jgi:ribose transport system substrate-binding protein
MIPRSRAHRWRTALLTAAAALALATTACATGAETGAGGGSAAAGQPAADTPIPTVEGPVKVGIFLPNSDIVAYIRGELAGAERAGKATGLDYQVVINDKYDSANQFNQIQDAITQKKFNVMIVHSSGPNLCKLLTQAAEQKILVVPIVAPLCGDPTAKGEALYTPGTLTYVGGLGNYDGNVAFTRRLAENLAPGKHTVVSVNGPQGSPNAAAWDAAVTDGLGADPDVTLSGTVYTDLTIPESLKKVTSYLQGHPEVDTIAATYVDVAQGSVKAVEQLGLKDKVKVYVIGADTVAKTFVQNGQIAGTAPYFPASIIETAMQAVKDHVDGKPVPRYIGDDGNAADAQRYQWLDASNIDSYTPQF